MDQSEGMSGLFQALLGQTAELPQPRMNHRPEALDVVNVDAVWRNIPLVVHHNSMIIVESPIRLQPIGPDLSQRLGEVFSFLDHAEKITLEAYAFLRPYHGELVAAGRDER